jgi:uncharacterized repeat protein (TIGR03803 family)
MWGQIGLWKTVCIVLVFCAPKAVASPATTTFTNLLSFDGTDGANPAYVYLVQGFDGNLYGTTFYGGANDTCSLGCGTVFEITPAGVLTTLHSFDGTDGSYPWAGLVQATNGNLYGTTAYGGANDTCSLGCGTIFEITPAGKLTTLHSFDGTDGARPEATLVRATNGNFYGTTYAGGANDNCTNGCGTVFEITPAGTLTTLHSFCSQGTFPDCTDGANPIAGLIQATNGNFYGTTNSNGADGEGTVFEITAGGTLTTLHSFCSQPNCADGQAPYAGLVQAANGNFYGTTSVAGANPDGTVFEITAAGALTTLYSFCSKKNCSDGVEPFGGLLQATNGNFFGTTVQGGAHGVGTVFEITSAGKLTTLHSFDGTDGEYPEAGLVQATNGNFYGTTYSVTGGCPGGCGTVFSLSVGLGPFVETLPASGKVGAKVIVLGNNLTGSTSVTFNGTAATFTVVSSTEITTTVPTGATTGTVEVITPSGTLNSNVKFRVTP